MQNGVECYCSREYGRHGSVPMDECNVKCPRCFMDDADNRALNYSATFNSSVTLLSCAIKCMEKGYFFAGIQSGDKCYCGYDVNRYRQVADEECDVPCIGDSEVMCGGHLRNSVYKTHQDQIIL
ncbi:hypothetical protein EB796_008822 [Bugula neritina]|uniref:WSC domain-containing protein n=1 Tax=Bugula neritina TaxID=10212 RepID=A0A7J7K5G2_BUGNE|nr:hypothetical protein EB796_008822 [Bugula neritina]